MFVTAAWVAAGFVTIALRTAAVELTAPFGLTTRTTRSPAWCALLMMVTRSWLFQPVQAESFVDMLPSGLMLMPK